MKTGIEEFRESLMNYKKIKEVTKKGNFNKTKEEFKMPLPNITAGIPSISVQPVAGPGAPGMPGAPAQPVGTGLSPLASQRNQLQDAAARGFDARPLAIIVDGNEIYVPEYDPNHPQLKPFIEQYRVENAKDVNGEKKYPKYSTIRAVKDYSILNGANPNEFIKKDPKTGEPVFKLKRPNLKGYLIKFKKTEGDGHVVELIKKADFQSALYKQGIFNVAGTVKPEKLNPEELDIPVMITIIPSERTNKKLGRKTPMLRTGAKTNASLQKEKYPDKKNVSMLDIFNMFPVGQYKYERVVPLKIYETIDVNGKKVGQIDLTKTESKLTQYKSNPNPLVEGYGAEIMKSQGYDADKLQAAFTRSKVAGDYEQDALKLVLESYTGPKADARIQETYVNDFLQSQFMPL